MKGSQNLGAQERISERSSWRARGRDGSKCGEEPRGKVADHLDRRILADFRMAALQLSVAVSCIGGAGLLAWLIRTVAPGSYQPAVEGLTCSTGAGLLLGGLGLAASLSEGRRPRISGAVAACLLVVLALAGLWASTGRSALILGADKPIPTGPLTLTGLLLIGLALLAVRFPRGPALAHPFALAAGILALFGLTRQVYLQTTHGVEDVPIAPVLCYSALAALAVAIVAAWPRGGPLEVVVSRTAGGHMVRQTLPAIFLVLPFSGWLRLEAQRAGLFGTEAGLALMVTLAVTALLWVIFHNAGALTHLDAELSETAESLETTLLCIGDGVICTDTSGNVTRMNRMAERLTGWSAREAIGLPIQRVFQIVNEDSGKPMESPVQEVLEKGTIVGLANHTCLISRDGAIRPIADSGAPIRSYDGSLQGVVLVFRDMTEERESERALRASREDLEATLRSIGEAVVALDALGRITRMNAVAEALTGWAFEDAAGKPYDQVVRIMDASTNARLDNPVPRVLAEKAIKVLHRDLVLLSHDGEKIPVALNVAPILNSTGEARGCVLVLRNVQQERRARQELSRSRKEFLEVIERSPSWILILKGSQIAYANRAALAAFGYPCLAELKHRRFLDLVVREERGSTAYRLAILESGGRLEFPIEQRFIRKDGSEGILEIAGVARVEFEGESAWLAVGTEITERKKLEHQLFLAERMASLGVLAAGIAHEINNPLSYVVTNLDTASRILERDPDDWPEVRDTLREILAEASDGTARVRSIVRDLKTFSRVDGESPQAVDLMKVLESACHMARKQVEARASLDLELEPLPVVVGDATRLGQVFLNLLVNAAEAIQPGTPGIVKLRGRTHPDGSAVIEVEDSGPGITPQMVGKIFDPFFTTKPPGAGTGLGLAICHSIVTSHGGKIEVESEVGRGSIFRVTLPVAPAIPPAREAAGRPRPGNGCCLPNSARVLVIDDEERIALSIRRLLADRCVVEYETCAARAMERLLAGQDFDVILCDLQMPGMTGMDFFEDLRRSAPDLADKVAFLTGGAYTDRARQFQLDMAGRCLEKPFSEGDLLKLICGIRGCPGAEPLGC